MTMPSGKSVRDREDWSNTVRTKEELDTALSRGLRSGRSELSMMDFDRHL